MADTEEDPFEPPPVTAPVSDPSVMHEWSTALNDPGVRAALLSTGLQLMQPAGFGQTVAGHLGMGIGAAGETTNLREKMDRDERDSDSKAALRESQASTGESRARTAEMAAEAARQRLKTQEDEVGRRKERDTLTAKLRAQGLYQNYVKEVNAGNQKVDRDVLMKEVDKAARRKPVLDYDTWLQNNPMLRDALTMGTGGGGGGRPDEVPIDPRDETRAAGTVYMTPRGAKRWTGTGWIDP